MPGHRDRCSDVMCPPCGRLTADPVPALWPKKRKRGKLLLFHTPGLRCEQISTRGSDAAAAAPICPQLGQTIWVSVTTAAASAAARGQALAQQLRQLGYVCRDVPGGHRPPAALTCAKLGALCAREMALLHRASEMADGPALRRGAFFVAMALFALSQSGRGLEALILRHAALPLPLPKHRLSSSRFRCRRGFRRSDLYVGHLHHVPAIASREPVDWQGFGRGRRTLGLQQDRQLGDVGGNAPGLVTNSAGTLLIPHFASKDGRN